MGFRLPLVSALVWLATVSLADAQTVISIETVHDADHSAIVAHSFAQSERVTTLGHVSHRSGMAPIATLSHDGNTLALLNVSQSGEPRRHADLLRFDVQTREMRVLMSGLQAVPAVFSASDHEVFVVRSEAVALPTDDETRTGHLENERLRLLAVDPDTGRSREVMTDVAYMLHPIGVAASGELVAIRAAWNGGRVVAIHTTTGRERTLLHSSIDAFRDASLSSDGTSVVTLRRNGQSSDVVRAFIEDGATEVVLRDVDSDAAPLAVGPRSTLITNGHSELRLVGPSAALPVWSTGGSSWLHAIAASRSTSIVWMESVSESAREVLVLRTDTGACTPLRLPRGTVVHVAGVAESAP